MARKSKQAASVQLDVPLPDDWEKRLEEARAQRHVVKPTNQITDGKKKTAGYYETKIGEPLDPEKIKKSSGAKNIAGALVSVDDVLQTANLNDRMELARVRHSQVLAMRDVKDGKLAGPDSIEETGSRKATFRAAFGGAVSDNPIFEPALTATTAIVPIVANDQLTGEDEEKKEPKRRRIGGYLVLLALVGAAGLYGPLRGYFGGEVAGQPDAGLGLQTAAAVSGTAENSATAAVTPNPSVVNDAIALTGPTVFPALEVSPQIPQIPTNTVPTVVLAGFPASLRAENPSVVLGQPTRETPPDSLLGALVPNYAELPPAQSEFARANGLSHSITDTVVELSALGTKTDALSGFQSHVVFSAINRSESARLFVFSDLITDIGLSFPGQLQSPQTQVSVVPVGRGSISNQGILENVHLPSAIAPPKLGGGISGLEAPVYPPLFALLSQTPEPYSASVSELFSFTNLVVHAPAGLKQEVLDGVVSAFQEAGFDIGPPKRVAFSISKTNVRFFHTEDGAGARALAEAIGGISRDFTSFRPSPKAGTIEVYLAGKSGRRRSTGGQTGGATGGRNSALINLRNRLVESLKRGDHL